MFERLGRHNLDKGLHLGEAHGIRRFQLSLIHGVNTGAHHLRGISGHVDGKSDDGHVHRIDAQLAEDDIVHDHEEHHQRRTLHDFYKNLGRGAE